MHTFADQLLINTHILFLQDDHLLKSYLISPFWRLAIHSQKYFSEYFSALQSQPGNERILVSFMDLTFSNVFRFFPPHPLLFFHYLSFITFLYLFKPYIKFIFPEYRRGKNTLLSTFLLFPILHFNDDKPNFLA